jgi:hypothetical protein
MNPYKTPDNAAEGQSTAEPAVPGRPCLSCGSSNTARSTVLRNRPSIFFVILFGWLFLLIRGAFARRSNVCRDCGAANSYKSAGSWLAMGVLIILVLLILGLFAGEYLYKHP